MKWLDSIPFPMLLLVAVLLALAPFSPAPHLWEKFNMLMAGELVKPMDIFDLFLHGTPLLLVMIKLILRRGE